jgi:putative cell wall-binding protein
MRAARLPVHRIHMRVRSALLLASALLLLTGLLPATADAQVPGGAVSVAFEDDATVVAGTPSPVGVTVAVTDRGTLRDDTPLRLVGELGAAADGAEVALVGADGEPDVLEVDDDGRFVFPREDRAPLTLGGTAALTSGEGLALTLLLNLPAAEEVELSVGMVVSNERSAGVVRRSGRERVATAADISAKTFNPGVPVAYIARADAFPDALAAGPTAGLGASPILLSHTTELPAATVTELTRLRPRRIVVLGGPGAIADPVLRALQAHTAGAVTRLAGANRYATAAAIARARHTDTVDTVLIATGEQFPDALSGGPLAAMSDAPVLLVGREHLPAETAAALGALQPRRIVVLGGSGAVSNAVTGQLTRYASEGVSRIAGATRHETSAAISRRAFSAGAGNVVYLATAQNFPDSLAGAPSAIVAGAPLLLTGRDAIHPAVGAELQRLEPGLVVLLGGEGVVSPAVAAQVAVLTRDVEPDRARFTPVGAPASVGLTPVDALTIEPLAPEGPAALRPGDRFTLSFSVSGGGSYVVDHRAAGDEAWVPLANPTAAGEAEDGTTAVSLNAPTTFGAFDLRVRVSEGARSQTAVLENAMTVGLRFRPPMFSSLIEGVDGQSQIIAVSPVRGLEEDVRLDADLTDAVLAGVDYRDATLTQLHGTGSAQIVRNRPPDFAEGRPACALCIEYTAGDGDSYTEGSGPLPAPIIAFRLDGVDAPDIDGTFIGRFFRYDDMHGVQWPFSIGTPGAVASAQISNLERANDHQLQRVAFALPGAPGQVVLEPGEEVVIDLSEAEQGAADYSKAFASVSGGGGHGLAPAHEPPPSELGTAELDVEPGESAILTFTAGPDGVLSLAPEGPVVEIYLFGVEADDESEVYTATITRSDSEAVTTATFAVRAAGLQDVAASDLDAGRADQQQTFTATLDGQLDVAQSLIIDLSGAQAGGVDYRDGDVTLTGGSGSARLVTFEEDAHGGGMVLVYASGGDADGTTLRLAVDGVTTEDVDQSHFAPFFRSDGNRHVNAVFDVGAGSPFISPFVSDLDAGSDEGYQFISVGLRDALAPGATVDIDLSSAEVAGAGYGDAAVESFDGFGEASLEVTEGATAIVRYTAGEDGVPAGALLAMELRDITTAAGGGEHLAVFSREGEERTASVRFAIRDVPTLSNVSASDLAADGIGLTQTLRATVSQDLRPGETIQIDLSGAEAGAAAYGGVRLSVAGGTGTATLEAYRGEYVSINYRPGPEGDPDGTELVFALRGVNTDDANETHLAAFSRYPEFDEFGIAQDFYFSRRSARFDIGTGGPFLGPPMISSLEGGSPFEFQFAQLRLTDALRAGDTVVIDLSPAQAGAVDYGDASIDHVAGNGTAELMVDGDSALLTFTAGPGGVRAGRRMELQISGIRTEPVFAEYAIPFIAPGGRMTARMWVYPGHFEDFSAHEGASPESAVPYRLPLQPGG